MSELACLLHLVFVSLFFVAFLIMEIVSTLNKKSSKNILSDSVDQDILDTVYAFICECVLQINLIDMIPFDWGVFPFNRDKRICNQYGVLNLILITLKLVF